MIEVVVDYRNLQFFVYEDGRLTMDNPLPVEVQRVVLNKVIHDVVNEIRAQINADVPDRPPGLKEQILH